ncbi:hypothetical protein B0T24DRAFT_596687 [Lasiosphaeria ovina]|uniref:Uncharacterized protein n=1 Tax=Lasiosphaeria ovina TaxID=92902 RepID=A0AAE0JZB6_9PEZI|nr:hypothetical protein B0T24DRAFT_596687 [Lasiosphaeria ovina]
MDQIRDLNPVSGARNSALSFVFGIGQRIYDAGRRLPEARQALSQAGSQLSEVVATQTRDLIRRVIGSTEAEQPARRRYMSTPVPQLADAKPIDTFIVDDQILTDPGPLEPCWPGTVQDSDPDGYQAVRVLFLAWESMGANEMFVAQTERLREMLEITYKFAIHQLTIPDDAEKPDACVVQYLVKHGFLSMANGNHERELVILVYNGGSVMQDGELFLTGETGKMPWDWIERRLASAPYDALLLMNCTYAPGPPKARQQARNVVLAALGDDTPYRRQAAGDCSPEIDPTLLKLTGKGPTWPSIFLEMLLHSLDQGPGRQGAVLVAGLYADLLVTFESQTHRQRDSAAKLWPYCQDFARGGASPAQMAIEIKPTSRIWEDSNPDAWSPVSPDEDAEARTMAD